MVTHTHTNSPQNRVKPRTGLPTPQAASLAVPSLHSPAREAVSPKPTVAPSTSPLVLVHTQNEGNSAPTGWPVRQPDWR